MDVNSNLSVGLHDEEKAGLEEMARKYLTRICQLREGTLAYKKDPGATG